MNSKYFLALRYITSSDVHHFNFEYISTALDSCDFQILDVAKLSLSMSNFTLDLTTSALTDI